MGSKPVFAQLATYLHVIWLAWKATSLEIRLNWVKLASISSTWQKKMKNLSRRNIIILGLKCFSK